MSDKDVRPTPTGVALLDATGRGLVRYLPYQQIVIWRKPPKEVLDVSLPFVEMQRNGWVQVPPYSLDMPPAEVLCVLTTRGEDALMEAQQASKKRKAKR